MSKGNYNSYTNGKDITEDNFKAKSEGLSYGKYKAGERAATELSDYKISETSFLRPTKQLEPAKAVAFMR